MPVAITDGIIVSPSTLAEYFSSVSVSFREDVRLVKGGVRRRNGSTPVSADHQ